MWLRAASSARPRVAQLRELHSTPRNRRLAGSPARSGYDAPVSLLSGLFTGMFNMGGPPLIAHVYRRDEAPDVLRATIQTILLVSVSLRLATAFANGMLTNAVWRDAAIGVIASVAGAATGLLLGRRISAERFQRTSWLALVLLGVGIAFSSL